MNHRIEIFDEKKLISNNLDINSLAVKACLLTLKREKVTGLKLLTINFTDDEKMTYLNNKYMGYNETTDVLSFNEISNDLKEKYKWPHENNSTFEKLGEIIISVPQVQRQCDNNFRKECTKLVIHGLLHILGYDHALKKEELIMFNKTDDILSYIFNKN
ncbi:MAG: rRNA maturation RNase YbeY [Chloroflexi bacterium]|nr:rRNA maturation RNase YbeY [Chloroflexota bacterium]